MDSVLEKITLYDILGYLFPGSVLVLLIMAGMTAQAREGLLTGWREYPGILWLVFFAVSYLAGIMLSEVAEWFQWAVCMCKALCAKAGNAIKNEGTKETGGAKGQASEMTGGGGPVPEQQRSLKLPELMREQIMAALINSGIREPEDRIRDKLTRNRDEYSQYMYGTIHNRPDCKRVHNYGSAYVMCRNVSMALCVGAMVMYIEGNASRALLAGCLISGVLFAVRGGRFQKKKELYTMICFVDRFTMQEQDVTIQLRGEESKKFEIPSKVIRNPSDILNK